jgi:hypothetical protein
MLIVINDARDIRLPGGKKKGRRRASVLFDFSEALSSPGPQKENLALS